MNRKVTVVGGAGNVGATVARAIAVKELADVVIVDIAAEKAQGIALDIFQACPIDGPTPGWSARPTTPRPPTPTSSSSRPACRASRA